MWMKIVASPRPNDVIRRATNESVVIQRVGGHKLATEGDVSVLDGTHGDYSAGNIADIACHVWIC